MLLTTQITLLFQYVTELKTTTHTCLKFDFLHWDLEKRAIPVFFFSNNAFLVKASCLPRKSVIL